MIVITSFNNLYYQKDLFFNVQFTQDFAILNAFLSG